MLVTTFKVKSILYRIICGVYQAADVGRIHPMRERSLRALQRSVDDIEREMPDALGFDSQRELIEYALSTIKIEGPYLEFGVYTLATKLSAFSKFAQDKIAFWLIFVRH